MDVVVDEVVALVFSVLVGADATSLRLTAVTGVVSSVVAVLVLDG